MVKNETEENFKKGSDIFVNGRSVSVNEEELTFDQVVTLAGYTSTESNITYTVTYLIHRGSDEQSSALEKGQKVTVVKGMIFDVLVAQKGITIIVNGKEKFATSNTLTYDELLHLTYNNPPTGPNVDIVISYHDGPEGQERGTLPKGGKVEITEGMSFVVVPSDKS